MESMRIHTILFTLLIQQAASNGAACCSFRVPRTAVTKKIRLILEVSSVTLRDAERV